MTDRPNHRGQHPEASGLRTGRPPALALRGGFTLVEMVVVIGIILLIAAMVVPATTTLWNERKMSETINTAKGVFMTSRVRSLDSGGAESGFFVFVDERGNQRITAIEQPADRLDDPAWQNVFVTSNYSEIQADPFTGNLHLVSRARSIANVRDHVLPRPIRIVPRYVANAPGGPTYEEFDEAELANNDFANSANEIAQRHRNFFSVVFSTSGRLIVNRDVNILDNDDDGDGLGDRTGLAVGPGPTLGSPTPPPTTSQYYGRTTNAPANIGAQIKFLVVDRDRSDPPSPAEIAINFPSVDGLLVYDDALFNELPDPATKRQFLLDTATPLYVGRYTGMVIRGPIGEN